jgi:phage gpG-like protein
MSNITTLANMAAHLAMADARILQGLHLALEKSAQKVEKRAKGKLGNYQDDNGMHPAWAELADSTKADRVNKGFSENDPLLRTGGLRDSITHETRGLTAVIGTDSDVAVYQELGTAKIPPRPFLGAALYEELDAIKERLGHATVYGIVGGNQLSHDI